MRATMRQFRRAPGRIVASIVALTLAMSAVGVLAIPAVTSAAIREASASSGLPDLILATTPVTDRQVARIASLPGVATAEAQVVVVVDVAEGFPASAPSRSARLVGVGFGDDQRMDRVGLVAGRAPRGVHEAVASPGLAALGDTVQAGGSAWTVVGIGETMWWSSEDALYVTVDAARQVAPTNRIVVTAIDDDAAALDDLASEVRGLLATEGDTFLELPVRLPAGTTPIDEEIRQVSTLIGLLGIAAGAVALVLLASTTSTLIAKRSREVAIMRALGARQRVVRRRLQRTAIAIAAASIVVGLPLGVIVANVIGRMVLVEFVGLTPDIGVDPVVLAGSAAGVLGGAWLVSVAAARRVARLPLAGALRDREGAPFGRRRTDRLVARLRVGGLAGRLGVRASVHRRARALAVAAQLGAAVGSILLVVGLVASVNDFNAAARAPWLWETEATARDAGLPLGADDVTGVAGAETGIVVVGEIGEWELDVFGLDPATAVFDPRLRTGRWLDAGSREAVVSAGFARHRGLVPGDDVTVELASGPHRYTIVGTADDAGLALYLDRAVVGRDLGRAGGANVVWGLAGTPPPLPGAPVEVATAAEVDAADAAGRAAIVGIFAAIGAVVATVAAVSLVSMISVDLHERRHELATIQALGGRRRHLRSIVGRELLPLTVVGLGAGMAAAWWGARFIIGSFEASNAVDIGTTFALSWLPWLVIGTVVVLGVVAAAVVRAATRGPVAAVLRSAA